MRSTSTSSSTARLIPPSPRFRAWRSARSRSRGSPSPTRSPAGGSATPWPLPRFSSASGGAPPSSSAGPRETYQAKRDLLLGLIEAAGFVAYKPRGAYYILTDAAHFLRRFRCEADTAFAMYLVKEL